MIPLTVNYDGCHQVVLSACELAAEVSGFVARQGSLDDTQRLLAFLLGALEQPQSCYSAARALRYLLRRFVNDLRRDDCTAAESQGFSQAFPSCRSKG
jgi:hypothetical protein